MPYRVLIVDDEPPFLRALKRGIAGHSDFEVVSDAFNGVEALQKARSLRPDLLIADIKMPGMNGIELIKRVESELPDTLCVIISGYQDFNYAREAIKTNAIEYLLKPVVPEQLDEVLQGLRQKLGERRRGRRREALRALVEDGAEADAQMSYLFDETAWTIAIMNFSGGDEEVEAAKNDLEGLIESDPRRMSIGGAKRTQSAAFGWRENERPPSVDAFAAQCVSIAEAHGAHVTIATCREGRPLERLGELAPRLSEALLEGERIGVSRHISLDDGTILRDNGPLPLDTVFRNNLRYLMINQYLDEVTREMEKLFRLLEREECSKAEARQAVMQVVLLAQEVSTARSAPALTEKQIVSAFDESTDYDSLLNSVMGLITGILGGERQDNSDCSATLAAHMREYVYGNLGQPISLQSICNAFSLSQPTVSRLFRENFGESFNEYLTKARMDCAIRLMKERPGMLLKDVAEIVGYADQHYFSRKFKQFTGKSPSDYLANQSKEKS